MSDSCSRRQVLRSLVGGSILLPGILSKLLADDSRHDPLAPKASHFPARAKQVIFLFSTGGVSHIDTFDPKPLLNKLNGQERPAEFGEAKYQFVQKGAKLLGSARKFAKHGKSGVEVSDLLPHTAKCIDDIAVVRSCHCDKVVHSAAQYELFGGRVVPGFPSVGSCSGPDRKMRSISPRSARQRTSSASAPGR